MVGSPRLYTVRQRPPTTTIHAPARTVGKPTKCLMITALIVINANNVSIGFVGDHEPQYVVPHRGEPDLSDRLRLQAVLRVAVEALLTPPRSLRLVVIEPPLLSIHIKHQLAQVLLRDFHVSAIGFFPKSVSCLAGNQLSEGLVVDKSEKLVVPCYDFRELTPMIRGNEEEDVVEEVRVRLTIDTRKPVTSNIVTMTDESVWLGASALLKQRQVWPLLTRDKFKARGRVWDPLYDIK